jgi:hypothetical protein
MKTVQLVALTILLVSGNAVAKIPEPDAIYYGTILLSGVRITGADTDIRITVSVGGRLLDSYTMGQNPDAGDSYVLRIPMDSLEPRRLNTATAGDTALIRTYASGVEKDVKTVMISGRGAISRLNLGDPDADGDGVPDVADNCPQAPNSDQADLDNDDIGDVCDDDIDGDGTLNNLDAFPWDPAASTDTDGDGLPDNYNANSTQTQRDSSPLLIDNDDDNDGVDDAVDNCPLTVNETQEDVDQDGIGNACDSVDDSEFCFPLPINTVQITVICL